MRQLSRKVSAVGATQASLLLALLIVLFSASLDAHGVSGKDAVYLQGLQGRAIGPLMYLGAKHMVTGYDHLLFLVGVIFFLYRLKDVVMYVSLFTIGHSVMMANGVYLTDSDWHDTYDRTAPGQGAPIAIGDNVWLGDSVIVCKGVTIGDNSIVGAGAVVVDDVPANVVAAGNPARVVKELDTDRPFKTRREWFADPARLSRDFQVWDRALLEGNSLGHWLRYLLRPDGKD